MTIRDHIFRVNITDEALRAVLNEANVPSLMMAMIHMTGDTGILKGAVRPNANPFSIFDFSGGLKEQEGAIIRNKAFEVLQGFRTNPRLLPAMPSKNVLAEMINFIAGEIVPEKYREMLLEDFLSAEKDKEKIVGEEEKPAFIKSNAVICAIGQLNRPVIPDIPGWETFTGTKFHSSEWSKEHDFSGKRLGIIGTGSSGMQIVTALAGSVEKLVIFQRTPHWAVPVPHYLDEIPAGKNWALQHIPFYRNWYRLLLFWKTADSINQALIKEPSWRFMDRSVNAFNELLRTYLVEYMRREVNNDPALMAKIVPDYPPYGKRMLIDAGWYKALKQPNVELITGPVKEITNNNTIIDQNLGKHEVDAIILATGFHPLHLPFTVTGRYGVTLTDAWGGAAGYAPRAYLGITLPGFPNFFFMYGPNSNVGTTFSIISISEFQIRYIITCLKEILKEKYTAIAPTMAAFDAYNIKVDAQLDRLVWNHHKVKSWYNNWPDKRSATNLPFPIVDYWMMTAKPDMNAYHKVQKT